MAVPPMGAAPANTYMSTGASAPQVREDLADIIYRIDPAETPLLSALSRVSAKQVLTEWIVQELHPVSDNAQPEGFTALMQQIIAPVRMNNVCQIMVRTVGVSNTLRVVDVVGGEDEYNRQLLLRGLEVKRDLEFAITSPFVKAITDPRHMSGLPTYLVNGSRGTGGTMPTGDGSNSGTAGTKRDLSLSIVAAAMQQCWTSGGKPTLALMSGPIKEWFSSMSQGGTGNPIVAQNIAAVSPRETMTIVGAVDVYRSNFGELQLAPDRFCPDGQILLVSPDYCEMAPLSERDMIQQDYALTGDNSQGGVIFEGCIRPTAPKAHAWITDLNQ